MKKLMSINLLFVLCMMLFVQSSSFANDQKITEDINDVTKAQLKDEYQSELNDLEFIIEETDVSLQLEDNGDTLVIKANENKNQVSASNTLKATKSKS